VLAVMSLSCDHSEMIAVREDTELKASARRKAFCQLSDVFMALYLNLSVYYFIIIAAILSYHLTG
jgi:hypothetical protein